MNKTVKIVIAAVIGILLVVFIGLFIHGSLEMTPTPEQEEKARLGYGIVMFALGFAEIQILKMIGKE